MRKKKQNKTKQRKQRNKETTKSRNFNEEIKLWIKSETTIIIIAVDKGKTRL